MKTEFTHRQVIALLPNFALGALEPEELLAVDAYLIEHYELWVWLYQVEQIVASLASITPFTSLPGLPKAVLLARVRADLAERRRAP